MAWFLVGSVELFGNGLTAKLAASREGFIRCDNEKGPMLDPWESLYAKSGCVLVDFGEMR